MAICPFCTQKTNKIGESCKSCGKGYTVQDNPGKDPLKLLGKLIANKYIPFAIHFESKVAVVYEAFQPAVDRTVVITVIKPELYASEADRARIQSIIDKVSSIKQQNTLSLLEIVTIQELRTIAITYEAIKGETITDFMHTHAPNPLAYMHIIHQLLQAMSAYHAKGLCFPHIPPESVRIFRSGSDEFFVKVIGIVNASLLYIDEPNTPQDDVFHVGQIALSLLTGKTLPLSKIELSPDRAFLMPIAQLLMRTLLPKDQRFESCTELLQAFEIAFDLNQHEAEAPAMVSSKTTAAKSAFPKHTPIPYEQIIWMHRPPEPI